MSYEPVANELLEWTAKDAIGHIHSGSITAERYVSQLLRRYRESRELNAISWIDENRVLESARSVDIDRTQGKNLKTLAGLPIVIKDNINTVSFPTTAGTATLQGAYPQRNAAVVDILFNNGAILLAKTNMDELGREFTTANPTYGFARNPYDRNRVPGGGAGGTAAAIAARITPAGLGSDTAGSARIPASYCGIVGLRPSTGGALKGWTVGSWSASCLQDGITPIAYAVTTPGPMGRTVSDVALLNAIVTGCSDPKPIPLRGARIGVPQGFYWEDLDREVWRVSERALEKLRDAGAILISVDLRQLAQTADPLFTTVATMHASQDLADFLATNAPNVSWNQVRDGLKDKAVRARVQHAIDHPVSAQQAEAAARLRPKLALQYEGVFRANDISAIIYPTVPMVAPFFRPEGNAVDDTIDLNGKKVGQFAAALRNTHIASVIGTPSLTIPAGLSSSGLPVGLSLDGVAGTDTRLLDLALSLEAALGRVPGPALHSSPQQEREAPILVRGPSAERSMQATSDNLDHVLSILKQSAYLNLSCSIEAPPSGAPGLRADALQRRYDVDFRIDGCGPGMRAVNLLGGGCGNVSLNWSHQQNGTTLPHDVAHNFSMDDTFVFDDEGRNQLRGSGSGRMITLPVEDDGFAAAFSVDASGDIYGGAGIFAGVQGSYVLTGSRDRSRLNLHFAVRLMDPGGTFQTSSELAPLNGSQPDDQSVTCLTFLGEPDPDHPIQVGPAGSITHALLRAVHTDFDCGRGHNTLRSKLTLGPIVAHYRADVAFRSGDLSGQATHGKYTPVKLRNIKIEFYDAAFGSLEASITDGRAYGMALPGVSGPLFRMVGSGPIGSGTGRFANARGLLSMIAASDLAPASFSNFYLLHLFDPDRSFRC